MHEIKVKHHHHLDPQDWKFLRVLKSHGISRIKNTMTKWELGLDAVEFQPNEIKVSILLHQEGHDLVIEGSHAHREDELGLTARTIHRIIHIPSDVDTNSIIANLYPNGLLSIKAHKKKHEH